MRTNFDYIKEFVEKHHYDGSSLVVTCLGKACHDNIKAVRFSGKDIFPSRNISIDDIHYDIDSSLPEDVFYRYLEYLNKTESEMTYIDWMTKIDNRYEPMGIDKSESEKLKKEIFDKLDEMKRQRWF